MSASETPSTATRTRRKSAALLKVAQKRQSVAAAVNLKALVRVYLLDGSSKVLQMFDNCTATDVLIGMKYNLGIEDISSHALFRVAGNFVRRIDLSEKISDVLKDPTESGQDIRLLFRSWISYSFGGFEKEVFQSHAKVKQPTSALWLAYMEATFMCMAEKYYLTEDESILLGCLKMQVTYGVTGSC